jgi:hypothetical protein
MREDRKILFPEAIGMGLAIGFILCAGFQLVLRRYFWRIDSRNYRPLLTFV